MEAVVQKCFGKKVFLKISQNSQENTRARVTLLIKLHAWGLHKCFPVNFAKFSRTPFFIEHLQWLLLIIWRLCKKKHLFYGTTSGCFSSSLLLLLITLMFVFYSNSKDFKEFKSSISFSLTSLSSVLQWNLYKVDTICSKKKCPLYGDVRFVECFPKTQLFSKI